MNIKENSPPFNVTCISYSLTSDVSGSYLTVFHPTFSITLSTTTESHPLQDVSGETYYPLSCGPSQLNFLLRGTKTNLWRSLTFRIWKTEQRKCIRILKAKEKKRKIEVLQKPTAGPAIPFAGLRKKYNLGSTYQMSKYLHI